MLSSIQLKKTLEAALPGSTAEFHDLTGTADHWQVFVTSPRFEGLSLMEQHKQVQSVFAEMIQSGELHALTIKTFTPTQWAKRSTRHE